MGNKLTKVPPDLEYNPEKKTCSACSDKITFKSYTSRRGVNRIESCGSCQRCQRKKGCGGYESYVQEIINVPTCNTCNSCLVCNKEVFVVGENYDEHDIQRRFKKENRYMCEECSKVSLLDLKPGDNNKYEWKDWHSKWIKVGGVCVTCKKDYEGNGYDNRCRKCWWRNATPQEKLRSYGKDKIKYLARKKKIKGRSKMNKDELILHLDNVVVDADFPIKKNTIF